MDAGARPIEAPGRLAVQQLGREAPELAAFQDQPAQMASGVVGKNGFLHLGFERRGTRTIVAELDRRIPAMAQRALYPEQALPDLAWVFMISTTGCLLQGDRLALEIVLGPAARAHVTTQSATKIHGMDANYAAQSQWIDLDEGAYLELLPEPMIPHRQARFISETTIRIAPSATLLYSEILQPGRKHHHPDECFGARLVSLATSVQRPDGRLLCREKLLIEPRHQALRQTGVMDGLDCFGNLMLLTPAEIADRIDARIGAGVDHAKGLAFGASRLPNEAGLICKVLARETAQVKAKLRELWAIAREEVTGTQLSPPFFWR